MQQEHVRGAHTQGVQIKTVTSDKKCNECLVFPILISNKLEFFGEEG